MKKSIILLAFLGGAIYDLFGQTGAFFSYNPTTSPYTIAGGQSACSSCTSASSYDSFLGASSGYYNIQGVHNSALGYQSMYNNTSGNYNISIGSGSLFTNTSGAGSTAVGYNALYYNTASGSTAFGYNALKVNSTGAANTGIGYQSMFSNTTGQYNTAIGSAALYTNISGNGNTAAGYYALNLNTAGGNTAFGYLSLASNSTGVGNTGIGYQAMQVNSTGQYNTAVGNLAMVGLSQGNYNTAVGYNALSPNVSGSQNTALGYNAGPYPGGNTLVNTTALGYGATTSASNSVVIGNSSVTSIGGYVGWSTLSDGRFKKDIKEDVTGIAFISQLRPISYTIDKQALENFLGIDKSGIVATTVRQNGFVAQEVESLVKKSGFLFYGVEAPQNDKDHYSLRYADFVVPLVKAVQELNAVIKSQQNQIDSLKKVSAGPAISNNSGFGGSSGNILYQNIPNPSGGKTVIPYQLQEGGQGQVFIFDMMGNLKKKVSLNNLQGSVEIQSGELTSGLYIYSLVVGGVEVASKRMIIN